MRLYNKLELKLMEQQFKLFYKKFISNKEMIN